ncbi:sensor histidine kinase [Winogradskyella psychrotolerans]|uniref:sensor histidine kinase n=1 Tax=Winogradskyella psychrotolerans TaxID=1344585 RepID=UPI001C06EFE4|nr:ATP-binding protein [Winogradskyella psychrotolerans]MBU2927482.1 two-component sensor histidine kinase [Winogradskyella psychrotolerans]
MLNKLWLPYHQWYIRYSGFSNKNEKDDLTYFRDKLFVSILILTLALSSISYIPSGGMAIALDKWFVFVIDTIAVSVMAFLVFNRQMRLSVKKTIFSINLFLLSFALIIDLGLQGSGTILLFMLSVLITLYSGKKAGVISVIVSALFYVIVLLVNYYEGIDFEFFSQSPNEILFVVFTNNILFGLLTVLSVSFLVDHLHAALLKENQLQEELIEKHKNVIIAKERAEESDQLKSAFMTNMSHEIRTPMYGILGSAELLKSYHIDDEEYQEFVEVIDHNGNELLDVITDILNISKIETGQMRVKPSLFNVDDCIQGVFDSFLPEVKSKHVGFTLNNFISKGDRQINSDKEKLTAILRHLIENAVKYTSNGDQITLSCSVDSDVSHYEFVIKDTGVGIPEDKKETIFNPFYQVDVNNKNGLHGSGIGLSISKAYVEMLGGDMVLESAKGVGTSVKFTIVTDMKKNRNLFVVR